MTNLQSIKRFYSTVRNKSLKNLIEKGNLYPNIPSNKTFTNLENIIKKFAEIDVSTKLKEEKFTVAGRVVAIRDFGNSLKFIKIRQNEHCIQLVYSVKELGLSKDIAIGKSIRIGDIMKASTYVGKTNKGELSLFINSEIEILAVCNKQITMNYKLKNHTERFKHRYLDFIVNPESYLIIKTKSNINKYIRNYFEKNHYLEVETPVLSFEAGGAQAKPFKTKSDTIDKELELRISPELHLKKMVIGGFEKIFELGKVFRNEGIDATHSPEFTMCEAYAAYHNLEDMMDLTEDILIYLQQNVQNNNKIKFTRPFKRINIVESLQVKTGLDFSNLNTLDVKNLVQYCKKNTIKIHPPYTFSRVFDALISHYLEPECVQPTFLCYHPLFMSPLAKASKENPDISQRFELFVNKTEFANAYEELNDPKEQRIRFLKNTGDENSKKSLDLENGQNELFCEALEYGLPPTAGWGLGVDRLCAFFANTTNIKETHTFPLIKINETEN